MFYTFGTSLTLLFWKVWGNGKSGARAFAKYAWIPSAERKKCLAALLVETTSTWFQVPSLLPIVRCRPIVFALLFFFLQIERKWMDAQPPMKVIYFSRPVLKKRKAALSNSVTQDALCDETSFKLHNLKFSYDGLKYAVGKSWVSLHCEGWVSYICQLSSVNLCLNRVGCIEART